MEKKTKRHILTKKEQAQLASLKRHEHHHIIHKLHKKHKISYKTLFYMKEYGPHSHVAGVIIRESLKVILIASILSSIGGIKLQAIEDRITMIIPLIILLPALNSLIGSFGTIVSSKFTTMLYMGKAPVKWWTSKAVHELILSIFIVGAISSVYISCLAYVFAMLKGFAFDMAIMYKIIMVAGLATLSLMTIICLISITWGIYIFGKKEDPNNFLIPITTAVGDLGSMAIFTSLVVILF